MTSHNEVRYLTWATYLSAAATIFMAITGILFFTVGAPFGTVNDVFSVIQAILLIAVAVAFHQIVRTEAPTLSLAAAAIGILGMLVIAILQSLLVVGVLPYEQVGRTVIAASGGIGIWLILANYGAVRYALVSKGLAAVGMIVGVGYLALVVGFGAGGLESPLFFIGSMAAYYGYPIWAIWLGRAHSRILQPQGQGAD